MRFLQAIPQKRLIFYILLVGALPLLLVLGYFFLNLGEIEALQKSIHLLREKWAMAERKQSLNVAVRNHYKDADHFYIDKELETLIFLESETESLQKIVSNKQYPDDEALKKRLDFLTSGNRMIFTEGNVQSNPVFQETTEILLHPVEVNVKDIKTILEKIEGREEESTLIAATPPQLLILDFKIEKKQVSEKNQVFNLNLKLLKREFL